MARQMPGAVRNTPPALDPPSAAVDGVTLARARLGDEQAFAEIYLELQPRLRRYATGIVGQDADDVTAEAWLQIVRDLGSFRGDVDDFRGWTARIVRNRALDHLRSRSRRPADHLDPGDLVGLVADDDTERDVLDGISTRAAVDLIASLPREQAEAVLLRSVVGLDATAVGVVLGKSPGAVRVSTHRGLKSLARRLGAPADEVVDAPPVPLNRTPPRRASSAPRTT